MANVKFSVTGAPRCGRAFVTVRFYHHNYDERCRTQIAVPVERWNAKDGRLQISRYADTLSRECANIQSQLETLRERIFSAYFALGAHIPPKGWLRSVVCEQKHETRTPISELLRMYAAQNAALAKSTVAHYQQTARLVAQFEQSAPMYAQTLTVGELYQLQHWISETHSRNTTNAHLRKVRSAMLWAFDLGITTERPFDKYKAQSDIYGTPTYLTIEERDHLAGFDFGNARRNQIRDVFVFQAHIGCRISDLFALTKQNLTADGFLEYIQQKKLNTTQKVVRVPLTPTAQAIIERYAHLPTLVPYYDSSTINKEIKRLFEAAGLVRTVQVIDPASGRTTTVRLCDIASTHLARRTFIANLFKQTKSERLVVSMTGHTEYSRALLRYTVVDDETKKEAIKGIE